jgi:cold shock CspA family protein
VGPSESFFISDSAATADSEAAKAFAQAKIDSEAAAKLKAKLERKLSALEATQMARPYHQSAKEIARRLPAVSVTPVSTKRGKVKFYIHDRGFGFIIPEEDGKPDLFFHYGAVIGSEPERDDRVLYLACVRNGKPAAVEVKVL